VLSSQRVLDVVKCRYSGTDVKEIRNACSATSSKQLNGDGGIILKYVLKKLYYIYCIGLELGSTSDSCVSDVKPAEGIF
jgi:hypothetical protein